MASCARELALRGLEWLEGEEGVRGLRLAPGRCGDGPGGVFIAVEGIDGAGISTHSEALAHALRELLRRGGGPGDASYTKEPTYGPVGFLLHQIMRGGPFEGLKDPASMALLFAADRHYHLFHDEVNGCRGVIACIRGDPRPAIVVSDRYKYSSIAYQSVEPPGGRGGAPPGKAWLWLINSFAPPPHVLVYLDVDPDTAIRRIAGERWGMQLYEQRDFLERVRKSFEEVLALLAGRGEAEASPAGIRDLALEALGARAPGAPGWTRHIEACHYPAPKGATRYPVVVKVSTAGGSVEESFREVLSRVVAALEALGLAEALRG